MKNVLFLKEVEICYKAVYYTLVKGINEISI